MKQIGKQTGFTLIEVAISIIVLAIITTLAAPSMNSLLSKKYVRNAAKAFEETLRLGSAEARTRLIQTNTNQTITLCPYNEDRDNCVNTTPASQTGTQSPWRNNGWALFVDLNRNNKLDSSDTLISASTENAGERFLITFAVNPSNNRIQFGTRGPLPSSNYAPITFSGTSGTFQKRILIDFATGQTKLEQL